MISLLRQRNFCLLWVASSVSLLGTWALRIAVPISVLRLTGSGRDVAAVSAASLLGGVAVGWIAGAWVDRWDRRRVLVGGNVLQAFVVLGLAGPPPRIGVVIAVVAVESAVAQFLQPAENALVPRLVAADRATAANAWLAVSSNSARLAGPVLGGIVAAAHGLAGAAVLDSVTFLAAALAAAAISGRHRAAAASGAVGALRDGWTLLWRQPTVRAILLLLAVSGFGDGVMGSTQAVLATRVLHGDARLLGEMTSVQAAGGIISGLAAARWAGRAAPVPLVGLCFAGFGLADLAVALYPWWSAASWPAVVLFGLAGIAVGIHVGVIWTLFQSATEDRLRGRFFATIWTVASVTAAAGALVAGLLSDRVPVLEVMPLPGISALAAAFVFVRTARPKEGGPRRPKRREPPSPTPENRRPGNLRPEPTPRPHPGELPGEPGPDAPKAPRAQPAEHA